MYSIQVKIDSTDGYSTTFTESIEDITKWKDFSSSLSLIQKAVNVELTSLLSKTNSCINGELCLFVIFKFLINSFYI